MEPTVSVPIPYHRPSTSSLMKRAAVHRRLEDKIRGMCKRMLATNEDEELRQILVELRDASQQFIERFRTRLAAYPIAQERRGLNGLPPADSPAAENAA